MPGRIIIITKGCFMRENKALKSLFNAGKCHVQPFDEIQTLYISCKNMSLNLLVPVAQTQVKGIWNQNSTTVFYRKCNSYLSICIFNGDNMNYGFLQLNTRLQFLQRNLRNLQTITNLKLPLQHCLFYRQGYQTSIVCT